MSYYLDAFNGLKNWFQGNAVINEVQWGDVNELDTTTITDFPLAYIIHTGIDSDGNTANFKFQIILVTTLQKEYDDEPNKAFDLLADVIIDFIRAGNYTITDENMYGDIEAIYDQRGNRLYGYMLDVETRVKTTKEC